MLPNFLIIGAMKAGTTSLYRDLGDHPDVFFPADKEPGNLAADEVLGADGRRRYERRFARARPGQRVGDASTDYTKLPDIPGVPERARRTLGPDVRIVYMVREPVSRARSHHRHLLARGLATADFEATLAAVPGLVGYGCFAEQVAPWMDAFSPEAVLVLRLEDYAADRFAAMTEVAAHLGLDRSTPLGSGGPADRSPASRSPANWSPAKRSPANRSSDTTPVTGWWTAVRDNPLYRRAVRPLLSGAARTRIRGVVLPPPPPPPGPPTPATVAAMVARFRPDERRLRQLTGRTQPYWDFDAVVAGAERGGEA